MRNRIGSQIRQTSDVCIFCTLRGSREQLRQSNTRLPRRAYTSSATRRAPAGAAAAARQVDDDDDDFPLLRQNAAGVRPQPQKPPLHAPPAPPRPAQTPRQAPANAFPVTSVSAGGSLTDRIGSRLPPREPYQRPQRSWNRNDQQPPQRSAYRDRESNFQRSGNAEGKQPPQRSYYQNRDPQPRRDHVREQDSPPQRTWYGSRDRDSNSGRPESGPVAAARAPFRLGQATQAQERTPPDLQSRISSQLRERPKREAPQAIEGIDLASRISKQFADMPPRTAPPYQQRNTDVAHSRQDRQDQSQRTSPAARKPFDRPDRTTQKEDVSFTPQYERQSEEVKSSQTGSAPEVDGIEPSFNSSVDDDAEESRRRRRPAEMDKGSRFGARFELEIDVELPSATEEARPEKSSYRPSRAKSASFDFDAYEAELGYQRKKKTKAPPPKAVAAPQKPTLAIPEFMTVTQLAQSLKVKVDDLVKKLEEEGFEGARHDHMLDSETSAMFADIYGFEPIAAAQEMKDLVARPPPEDITALPPRPPIVTIMGHVDHGKTTILDWLRKSSVVAGEHGGITQHIGAFSVTMPGSDRQITFLDTPGHEAFLDMRKRGANVTDIVVLVVAADDSVKPQTIEAIKHALEARVQIIVAINKVDKHDADINKVKEDLTRHEIVVEDYGGDYQAIPVSGKTGQGMEDLEEAIVTLADVLDLRAEQEGPAEGQIIESKVTNSGRVATVLIKRGVLRVSDFIVAGPTWGRVRTLRNDAGQLVQEAYPGDPVQVDGWRGIDPTAGLEVLQAENEQHAKDVVELRAEQAESAHSLADLAAINATRSQEAEARAKVLAWKEENQIKRMRRDEGWVDSAASNVKQVHFVVKADVAGSVEAVVAMVKGIGNHEVQANIIHSGTGPVTESDVQMLATTGETGYAISFNQSVDPEMYRLAEAAGLRILNHNIIYKVTDDVKAKVSDALPPLVTQRVLGEAEVGKIFEITAKKQKIKIAGCKITNGTISRANQVRVLRNGETVYTGTLSSLKNVKKDVTEMRKGTECGIGFADWEDAQEGDQVQCFEEKEEKRALY